MKLLRYGPLGQEKPGVLDVSGQIRDLSMLIDDLTPQRLSPVTLQALQALDISRLPIVPQGVRLGAPVTGVRQFIAIGLNYRQHAIESGMELPKEPIVFNKAITSLAGPNDDVPMPQNSQAMDWEVELGVVIGSTAQRVPLSQALSHVAGYCLANDVSERDWQIKRSGQWVKGKSFDGFGPIGPWLVTTDELANPQSVELSLAVNGQRRQQSSTSDMIFSVAEIISHLSQFMTLLPGDVIVTGTPSGVGLGMKPPKFLQRGDVMTLDGGPLGQQRQRVV